MSKLNPVQHQQQGGLTLQEFAAAHSLTKSAALRYVKSGQVLGARKNPQSNKWWVYPPATLLAVPRPYTKRVSPGQVSADLPDLLPCGSAVAVEAGTESGQSGQHAPHEEAAGGSPPASLRAPPERVPEVYRSAAVLRACEGIEAAAARLAQPVFTVMLTEAQLLHAWLQSERALDKTCKDIRRGLCVDGDATVERALYRLLSKIVYARIPSVAQAAAQVDEL